jgi:hypothetical protein
VNTSVQSANSLMMRLASSSLCKSWKTLSMRGSNCWIISVHLTSCLWLWCFTIEDTRALFAVVTCCVLTSFFFWQTKKQQYHCDSCGICRIGGRDNFFHCDRCGMYSLQLILKYMISGLLLLSRCCTILSENEEVSSASKFCIVLLLCSTKWKLWHGHWIVSLIGGRSGYLHPSRHWCVGCRLLLFSCPPKWTPLCWEVYAPELPCVLWGAPLVHLFQD